jgi:hypothetical protein
MFMKRIAVKLAMSSFSGWLLVACSFVTMGEDAAGAKQSCADTGGTWMDAP